MYEVFYESKELGKYRVHTYSEKLPLEVIIPQIYTHLKKPKFQTTSCQILDSNNKVVWKYKTKGV